MSEDLSELKREFKELRELLLTIKDEQDRTNRALFEVPAGSPEGEESLIETLNRVKSAWVSGNKIVRFLVWLVLTMAAVGVALQQIKDWIF